MFSIAEVQSSRYVGLLLLVRCAARGWQQAAQLVWSPLLGCLPFMLARLSVAGLWNSRCTWQWLAPLGLLACKDSLLAMHSDCSELDRAASYPLYLNAATL